MLVGTPTWAIAFVLALVLTASLGVGWRLHGVMTRGRRHDGESAGAGYIVAAALGLLSLLIGFTLAMSVQRYEIRREMVVNEASAISTVWLRDQLFDEPFRSRLDTLLREYVQERQALANVGTSAAALDAADDRAVALQQKIWTETNAALHDPHYGALVTAELQATNQMFDMATDQRAALDAEVPPPVEWVLVVVAILASAITGYGLAAGGYRHRIASGAFLVAVALVITMIIELDQPRSGLIRIPQTAFNRVANEILNAPTSR